MTHRRDRPANSSVAMPCYVAMELGDVAVLLAAGLAAGIVNAVAGGGSLITFPALVGVGLAPVPANVTNSVSVTPGYLASVYGSRTELAEYTAHAEPLWRLLPATVGGTVIGCVLLLATPERAFELVVPFLVLGATAALAFQRRLRAVVGHPRAMSRRRQQIALHATVGTGAVYGGYFGAALGIMMVAALGLVIDEPLARINAIKNAVSATVGLVTVVAFAVFGPVDWGKALVLAPASLAGGYLGARLARRLPAHALRAVIVVVGVVVGILLLLKAH